MRTKTNSFKLIMAGNSNIPAMINSVICATIQMRDDSHDKNLIFQQVHIFHTEQSLQNLMAADLKWQEELKEYNISSTCLVHHVTNVESSNVDRFGNLVEQLREVVNPLDNVNYYVDLTGGISALKTILAVFAYVLDINNIFSLEIEFSTDYEERKKQSKFYFREIEIESVKWEYRKFPPIRKFDEFGKLNYTEVLRYKEIITELTTQLNDVLGNGYDLEHLRSSLLSGLNSRLIGEVTGNTYHYRHSVFSSSAGVEEVANILLNVLKSASLDQKTLGDKLVEIQNLVKDKPKYFLDINTLEHLSKLIVRVRNIVVHPDSKINEGNEWASIQSQLSSQLAISFLQFAIRSLTAFVDNSGNLVNVKVIDRPNESSEMIYFFGFDGDSTGDYLEKAFNNESQNENEVLHRSQSVKEAIKNIRRAISKKYQEPSSVIFAEGDNVLFKGCYHASLLHEIQQIYKKHTGLSSSIGYGKTLREATIAMKLAKAQSNDSCVGITLIEDQS